ncbi:hypothetical protein IY145_04155 [Methylosinus sp. H3A]|uniref:hypothetical protein n=1 Tax=Methylosinus sp. H3A TaxID=2785786 RepID=UPI0018C281D5|nr:hypothetical protein [Methylosinus sp. H3A]MBG0808562.1 hypothetical protein [Methylosinus sp. H3A]
MTSTIPFEPPATSDLSGLEPDNRLPRETDMSSALDNGFFEQLDKHATVPYYLYYLLMVGRATEHGAGI